MRWFRAKNGDGYAAPIRAVRESSGVYAIREPRLMGGWRVVYVGQSSSGCLYRTLTRHFQSWGRTDRGRFWEPMRGPIHTYNADVCEVALRVLPPGRVRQAEADLIRRLNPRDNPGSAPF